MKRALKYVFLLIIFVRIISAQTNITFNHLNVENGLSQSAVTCIFQDRQGFMWFGTQDGLNRYDGYNFRIFKNNPENKNSLSDNFIFSIIEDESGKLFIGTQSGNLHHYNPVEESFSIVQPDRINLSKSRMSSILARYYDKDKNVDWSGGLGQETGLKMENKSTGEIKVFRHNPRDAYSLSNDKVYSIFRDKSGSLWIGTFNGLDKLDETSGKFTHFRNNPDDPYSISDNFVWPVFEDSKGNLWIGTVKAGLNKYDKKANKFYHYRNDPGDHKSLNDNFIFSIYEDRSGVIWVGTNTGGVNYFNPAAQVFDLHKHNPKVKNSLSDDLVLALHVDKEGNYWIGTRNGGLDKYNHRTKEFTNYSHKPWNKNSPVSNSILTITEDRSGVLWLGSFSSGLNSFNPRTEEFRSFINDPSDPHSLSDNRVYSIVEDQHGDMWIGTYAGGLNKLDRNTGKITRFEFDPENKSSLSSDNIWSLAEDKSGKLWIGTFGGGVNLFNRENNNFTHFKNDSTDIESLGDNNIIRIFVDSKNNVWFGTTKGLCRYYRETNRFKTWREKDGLANDFVYGILEDKKGFLWISTNKGISKFNTRSEEFKNYYAEDGLQGDEFNQNAFARDNLNGSLLFGGNNGFNVFNPELITKNSFIPPVVFTNYIRYNTDDEEGKPIYETGISQSKRIGLTYKDNIVTFEFAALSFYNNKKNQYRYLLEGFNENWIQLGSENKITFTNLSPGEYKLKIIGSNNDGVWNESGASLSLVVSPPWWKTNIAYSLYAISLFSLLFGLRRFELNRREQKAHIRESELRLKATEAEKRTLQVENDRKTKELEEARQLQLSMLPKKLPVLPNLEFAAFMRTATEVGGDYYDFKVQDNGIINIALGDATGHGLQAGTMVTLMKGFFTSDSNRLDLQDFMSECSSRIKEIELGRILMSFAYLKIDHNKLYITNAGMPPIYYYNSNTGVIEEIMIPGMPLGAMRNIKYKMVEKEINRGDIILMLTDGLPEQMNDQNEMFDYSRIKSNFCDFVHYKPDDIIKQLIIEGDKWMKGVTQADDISFVIIKAT